MSYTKQEGLTIDMQEAVAQVAAQHRVGVDLTTELLASGNFVLLETGDTIWVACVFHDRPETPQVDFLTVAIAIRNGAPWLRANGQYVSSAFWHGVFPELVASQGVSLARKALMMIALGEPQPKLPIVPGEDGVAEADAIPLPDASSRSIRTYIAAANELIAPLDDVL